MNKHEFLETVKKQVLYIYDRQNIGYELSEHIDDSARDIMEEEGLSYDEAVDIAIKQMGNPVEIGKQLNKAHHPLLGYLILAAKAYLILNIIPVIVFVFVTFYGVVEQMHPNSMQNAELVAQIHEKVQMPTHRVIVDNVYRSRDGDNYYLTYRMRWKHDYTRYNSLTQLVYILDKDGNEIDYGRGRYSTFVGGTGSSMFDMPEDGVLYLQFRDGQMLVIDMKEYGYEEIENLD